MPLRKVGENLRKIFCFVVVVIVFLIAFLCECVANSEERKIVRVGWYETPFNQTDRFGRRSGYAYEYQQKIAAYANWSYEYVRGSWADLYQMLLDGKLDLMSDVSFSDDRADKMLFSNLPMGAESYYLCISGNSKSGITSENYSSLDGKTVGVNKGSFQEKLLENWAHENDIKLEIVRLSCEESDTIKMLNDGVIDAYVGLDVYGTVQNMIPIFALGSSDYFFVLNKSRHDLLRELNFAMNRIQNEDRYYNQRLQEKYLNIQVASLYFTQEELKRIASPIRVGYEKDFLPFCGCDKSGNLTGALNVFLNLASHAIHDSEINFEPVAFDSITDALTAMKNAEIDCVFPVDMTTYDAEENGALVTNHQMQTEMYVSLRAAEPNKFSLKDNLTVAVVRNNVNYTTFLMDYFPNWRYAYFDDREACCKAVANGKADCVLTSNYRLNLHAALLEKYNLKSVATGKAADFSFATRKYDINLYSVLNKVTHFVKDSMIDAALAEYAYIEPEFTFREFLRINFIPVLITLLTIIFVIVLLLLRSIRSERKATGALRALQESLEREKIQRRELNMTRHKAYTDPLTGLRSRHAYLEYIAAFNARILSGRECEFAIVIFDVNDLKRVNDAYGHEAGDRHIIAACEIICEIFKHSPVFRIGGDEFAAILEKKDFANRALLMAAFNKIIDEHVHNHEVVVSAGLAEFDCNIDKSCTSVFQRADDAMYERKYFLKGKNLARSSTL